MSLFPSIFELLPFCLRMEYVTRFPLLPDCVFLSCEPRAGCFYISLLCEKSFNRCLSCDSFSWHQLTTQQQQYVRMMYDHHV